MKQIQSTPIRLELGLILLSSQTLEGFPSVVHYRLFARVPFSSNLLHSGFLNWSNLSLRVSSSPLLSGTRARSTLYSAPCLALFPKIRSVSSDDDVISKCDQENEDILLE